MCFAKEDISSNNAGVSRGQIQFESGNKKNGRGLPTLTKCVQCFDFAVQYRS